MTFVSVGFMIWQILLDRSDQSSELSGPLCILVGVSVRVSVHVRVPKPGFTVSCW